MRLGVFVFVLAFAASMPAVARGRPDGPNAVAPEQLKQLAAVLDVVRHAERVEALPVREEGAGLSATHHLVEKPVALDSATARALSRLLVNYDWTSWSPMACLFQPGVAFRFRRGNEATVVEVCFMCGEMALDGIRGPLGRKKALFPAERNAFLRAAKKAFPQQFDGFDEEYRDVKLKGL